MKNSVVHQSEHSTIHHHDADDICQISLTGEIGDENTLKRELLLLAAHAKKNGISKVLVDNHELKHPISHEMQQWAHTSLELPLLNAGVDKIAIVFPKNNRVFSLINNHDSKRKRYFNSLAKAMTWLKGE